MTSERGIERGRGAKESGQQLAVLRKKWPFAFPIEHRDVRPPAASVVGEIAAAMGWSIAYTRGVLFVWKMAPVYCSRPAPKPAVPTKSPAPVRDQAHIARRRQEDAYD